MNGSWSQVPKLNINQARNLNISWKYGDLQLRTKEEDEKKEHLIRALNYVTLIELTVFTGYNFWGSTFRKIKNRKTT